MVRTSLATCVLALAFLLAIPSVGASPVGPVAIATITSGQAYNFDQPTRGFFRIGGRFTSTEPLDLGAAGIHATLEALLDEDDHGELVAGLPVTLTPRTKSQRVTVFETPPGSIPFYRLTVRTCIPTQETCPNSRGLDVGDYEFLIEGVNALVAGPTECGDPPGPGITVITGMFTLDDGINPPTTVLYDSPWRCLFQKSRVIILRTP